MEWPEKIASILSKGVSLRDMGIKNWGLNKSQALIAFDEFERLKIPILGGDILEKVDGELKHNYDNWYCNPNENEAWEDFVSRSIDYSRKYVNNYMNPSGRETFFEIVPDREK